MEQENDIIMFYNEKINELTKQFKVENTLQQQRHNSFKKKEEMLMSELEWIKKIAHKIDIENYYLVKRYTELKVEFETQKNDRVLLLHEDSLQKKRTEKLEEQLAEYKQLLQKLLKDQELQDVIPADGMIDSQLIEDVKKNKKITSAKNSPTKKLTYIWLKIERKIIQLRVLSEKSNSKSKD